MLEIDLFTLIFQAVNFLVMAAILGRFLFRPTLRMIRERERRIESLLTEAEKKQREADRLREILTKRFQEVDKEIEGMIRRHREKMERERKEVLARARREAETLIRDARNEFEEEKKKAIERFREEMADTVIELSSQVVRSVVTERVHHDLIVSFCAELWHLSEEEIAAYRRAMADKAAVAFVTTPLPFSEEERTLITDTFSALVDRKVNLEVKEDPSLIAGIRVKIADTIIDNTLKAQLMGIRKELGRRLKERA